MIKKIFVSLVILSVFTVAAESPNKTALSIPKTSVQLHSVKNNIIKDFKSTVIALSKMGFDGVELAGRYGPYADDPEGLKSFLASLNLKVSGAHIPTKNLLGDKGIKTFKFLKAVGTNLAIIPHDKRIDDPEKIDEFIAELKTIAKLADSMNMKVGYHNHSKEFKAFGNTTFWDHLASTTPKNVFLQLDVGWANYADADPIEYVKRYPNRTLTTHYKIRTKESEPSSPVTLGKDKFNWAELIKTNIEYGGTQWIVVEQEEYPQGLNALQAVEASKQELDSIIQALKIKHNLAHRADLSNTEPPNILFIYTDDQAPWALGRSGNEQALTPNLDKLAADGMYLPNAYATTPVCSPARASLLTSQYGYELGIDDWIKTNKARTLTGNQPNLGLDSQYETWPEVLQKTGYTTGLIGKWHLGTNPQHHPTKHGYDEFTGFAAGGKPPLNPKLEKNGKIKQYKGLTTDILTDEAIEFMTKNSKNKFSLSLHYRAPHYPFIPVAPEDAAPFENMDIKLPHPDYPGLNTQRATQLMHEYLSSVRGIDRNVGRLVSALDKLGLSQNTIVVFTSDHGYNIAHNGMWHKGNGFWLLNQMPKGTKNVPGDQRPNMYDNSIKVPTIVRWPNVIPANTENASTVSNLDWFPTLVELAKGKTSSNNIVRGKSIVPALLNAKTIVSTDYYAAYTTLHQSLTQMRMYSDGKHKLLIDFLNSERNEFYDLINDPHETINLLSNELSTEQQLVKNAFEKMILAKMKATNDPLL